MYEGIVYCHKYHLDKLLATRDTAPDCIRLAGGAAKSRVWTQMFADILGIPVETVNVNETGALGCTIAAATAVGDYASIDEAASAMCPLGARVLPNAENSRYYGARYGLYKKAVACLDGLWDDMQKVIEG